MHKMQGKFPTNCNITMQNVYVLKICFKFYFVMQGILLLKLIYRYVSVDKERNICSRVHELFKNRKAKNKEK